MSDYTFNKKVVLDVSRVRAFEKELYMAEGLSKEDAEIVADHLVEADERGVYSHGIQRNNIYTKRLELGGTMPRGVPHIIRSFGATAVVDGDQAMGMVGGVFAMNEAIRLARIYGTSTVSVTNSNHFGTCAYYVQKAADAGMIGFMWTINCGNIMAPWGGVERQLGNNPFGIAIPCKTRPTVVLDMATSVVARGKIVMAMKTHSPVPESWAFDVDGNPTSDATKAYWGTVQPFGGYKGYGMTVINAMLGAVLNNSAFGETIVDFYEEPDKVQNNGFLFQCIDINAIDNLDDFLLRMDAAVAYLKGGKKAEGVDEIYLPGEIEYISQQKALKEGIVYPIEIIEESQCIADGLGVKARLID